MKYIIYGDSRIVYAADRVLEPSESKITIVKKNKPDSWLYKEIGLSPRPLGWYREGLWMIYMAAAAGGLFSAATIYTAQKWERYFIEPSEVPVDNNLARKIEAWYRRNGELVQVPLKKDVENFMRSIKENTFKRHKISLETYEKIKENVETNLEYLPEF